jgi:hypothetical protein
MGCGWLYIESRTTPQHFCDKPGDPHCSEHQLEMDAYEQDQKEWDEIFATHMAVCSETMGQSKQCVF